jgi:hypothetical protein
MKSIFFIIGLILSLKVGGGEHSLHAHEHGAINVGMAVEKNTVEIAIDGPAESFLGFEYLPKSEKEKQILSDLKTKWTKNFDLFFAFDKKLNCHVTEASFVQVIDEKEALAKIKDKKETGIHSDVEAKVKLACVGTLSGTNVTVSLRKVFKNIKKLSIDVISTETKSIEISKPVQVFKI